MRWKVHEKKCERDIPSRGTYHQIMVWLLHCHNRTQAHWSPRRAPMLNYSTVELHRKDLTEGAPELRLDTGQDLNRLILKVYCQLTYPNMTEFAYPEACLHHSTFVAQCIVTDFLQVCHAHIAAAQLELDRKSTRLNSSHPSISRMPSSA